MRVLWITNIPSPYRVDFFNELGKRCELKVLFERTSSTERDESWKEYNFFNFNGVVMKGKNLSVDKALCFEVIKYLNKETYDYIVISNMSSPTGILAIIYLILNNKPYLIEGDGGIAKNGKGLVEKLKKILIGNAQLCLSTGKMHDEYYKQYGAKSSNILRYPFTSLKKQDLLEKPINHFEKIILRKKLNLPDCNKIVIGVGRFIYTKGFDVLIKSWTQLDAENLLIIVGGGEELEKYNQLIQDLNLKNILLLPFMKKEKLKEYYLASDIFVLPTREDIWGLVINEAMSYGLPVITTDNCVAGIELIENYENGFIVPVENSDELEYRLIEIIKNNKLQEYMSINNLIKIQKYTIEEMVDNHMDYFYKYK